MMFEHKAESFLNLSRDAQRQATVSCIGSLSGTSTPVTDRLLLESAPTPARSLEGRHQERCGAGPASSGPPCQMDSFLTPPTAFCFFAFEKNDPRIALSTSDI